jgi:cob(I)alamin adenosyltransferase
MPAELSDADKVARIDQLVSHIWMVRTFLKHCEEAEEDDELRDVYRHLYDYMMALGGPVAAASPESYLKMARKKLRKLREATDLFVEIQPEISSHTNFQMSVVSLRAAVEEITQIVAAD